MVTRPEHVKQLRQTILDLAVRGRLVPQDPNDEPASELLKRIQAEKTRLIKDGSFKRFEPVVDLTELSQPLKTPPGWALTNLQSLCTSITDGDHLPPPKSQTGVPFLVIGNVRNKRISFAGSRFVTPQYFEALDHIRRPQKDDLLYTLVGSYGIPIVVLDNNPFCVQRHIGIIRFSKQVSVEFFAYAMESRYVFSQADTFATGIAQKTVPLSGLRKIITHLPPFAEQCRIVAKLDELMTLCDQLETQVNTTTDDSSHFLEAVLRDALEPEGAISLCP
jgi:type I restriction enzyme S subunit